MVKRLLVVVLGFAVVVGGTVVLANVPATLVLGSGRLVSGRLRDMGGAGLEMRVRGTERTFPVDDVAVVDFVGEGRRFPDGELSRIRDDRHMLVLRGGRRFQGRLLDFTGDPLSVVFRVRGEAREFPTADVRRIYLAPRP